MTPGKGEHAPCVERAVGQLVRSNLLRYAAAMPSSSEDHVTLHLDGRDVVVTNPSKLLIPDANVRKLDLVNYYVAVAQGALRGAGGRPCVLVRYPDGIGGEFFFQKRAPSKRPQGLEVA